MNICQNLECGAEFNASRVTTKYCTVQCKNRAFHLRRSTTIEFKKYKAASDRRRRTTRRTDLRELVQRAKSVPCADCHQEFPYYVMDFDHVRGTKIANVSTLVRVGDIDAVRDEIAKCEVVCSNCHRIRTHTRQFPDE